MRVFLSNSLVYCTYQLDNRCCSLPQLSTRNVLCESVTEIRAGAVTYPLTGALFWNILCVISCYIRKTAKLSSCSVTGIDGNLDVDLIC